MNARNASFDLGNTPAQPPKGPTLTDMMIQQSLLEEVNRKANRLQQLANEMTELGNRLDGGHGFMSDEEELQMHRLLREVKNMGL